MDAEKVLRATLELPSPDLDELRAKVQNGTYSPPVEEVVKALIEWHPALCAGSNRSP